MVQNYLQNFQSFQLSQSYLFKLYHIQNLNCFWLWLKAKPKQLYRNMGRHSMSFSRCSHFVMILTLPIFKRQFQGLSQVMLKPSSAIEYQMVDVWWWSWAKKPKIWYEMKLCSSNHYSLIGQFFIFHPKVSALFQPVILVMFGSQKTLFSHVNKLFQNTREFSQKTGFLDSG